MCVTANRHALSVRVLIERDQLAPFLATCCYPTVRLLYERMPMSVWRCGYLSVALSFGTAVTLAPKDRAQWNLMVIVGSVLSLVATLSTDFCFLVFIFFSVVFS